MSLKSSTFLNDLAEATADKIKEVDKDIDEGEDLLNKLLMSKQWTMHFHDKFRNDCQIKRLIRVNIFYRQHYLSLFTSCWSMIWS